MLRGFGYYDATVVARVDAPAGGGAIAVTLDAEPGALYRFATVALPGIDAAGDKAATLRHTFPVAPEDPVNAEKVTAAETSLRTALGREGFAFAKLGTTEVTIDHEAHTASLSLAVAPNGARRFGHIEIRGKRLFSVKHLSRIARFHPGDPYDAARIDDFRRALIQTSLVSSVQLTSDHHRPTRPWSTSPSDGAGAAADDRGRARLRHGRGAARGGELAAPQPDPARGRGDRPRVAGTQSSCSASRSAATTTRRATGC